MIKNIIFDLAGVVLNLNLERDTQALNAAGLPDFEGCLKCPEIVKPVSAYLNGLMPEQEFLAKIRPQCKPNVTDEEIHWAMNAVLDDIPKARIERIIALKKNFNVYLLSNLYDKAWAHTVKQFALQGYKPEDCFDKIFLSYEMQLAKPDPRIYQQVIKETGIIPEETVFFDDTLENVEAAKKLGIQAYQVKMNCLEDTIEGKI